eukprot:817531-Pyramimonas_sp.AAC.1
MTFDAEDRALSDRLRQKYAGMVVDRSQEEALGEGVVRETPRITNTVVVVAVSSVELLSGRAFGLLSE